jgi:hypothetical protein
MNNTHANQLIIDETFAVAAKPTQNIHVARVAGTTRVGERPVQGKKVDMYSSLAVATVLSRFPEFHSIDAVIAAGKISLTEWSELLDNDRTGQTTFKALERTADWIKEGAAHWAILEPLVKNTVMKFEQLKKQITQFNKNVFDSLIAKGEIKLQGNDVVITNRGMREYNWFASNKAVPMPESIVLAQTTTTAPKTPKTRRPAVQPSLPSETGMLPEQTQATPNYSQN